MAEEVFLTVPSDKMTPAELVDFFQKLYIRDIQRVGRDNSAHAAKTAKAGHTPGVGDHTHQSAGKEGGLLDHGFALTGLGDNDHPQYLLASSPTLNHLHTRTELGADVSIVADTNTTIISHAVTMPTAGGPWRVVAFWAMAYVAGAASQTTAGWVDDQEAADNVFGDNQDSITGGFSGGFHGGGASRNTYVDGASKTFLLRFRSNNTGTVDATPLVGPVKSYIQTLVMKA